MCSEMGKQFFSVMNRFHKIKPKHKMFEISHVGAYIRTTKDSDFSEELKNILKAEFNQVEPNVVWCSDITYIWTFDYNHAYKLIFDSIQTFDNTVRIHSYCGYLSPEE